jgi:hypothetical protein
LQLAVAHFGEVLILQKKQITGWIN